MTQQTFDNLDTLAAVRSVLNANALDALSKGETTAQSIASDLVFADDKKVELEASGTGTTSLLTVKNSNGLIASLQVNANDVYLTNGAGGNIDLITSNYNVLLSDSSASFRPAGSDDGDISLGLSNARWDVVYSTTGAINTSDEDQKNLDVLAAEENEKVLDAIEATPIMNYQFKDAVEAKGAEKARVHYGTGAQTLKANLEAEGLDPFKYAVLCFDEWEANEGQGIEAGSRYGIRYGEFYALKIAVLERRIKALES